MFAQYFEPWGTREGASPRPVQLLEAIVFQQGHPHPYWHGVPVMFVVRPEASISPAALVLGTTTVEKRGKD